MSSTEKPLNALVFSNIRPLLSLSHGVDDGAASNSSIVGGYGRGVTNVWVIRGGRANSLVDMFIDGGVTGMGYSSVPDASGLDRDEIEALLRAEGTSATPAWHAEMLLDFVQRI